MRILLIFRTSMNLNKVSIETFYLKVLMAKINKLEKPNNKVLKKVYSGFIHLKI